MKTFLFATSETEKLLPLTEHLPAPLVPILNRPVIAHVIEQMARGGIKEFIASIYHLGASIEAYCGDGRRWGARIDYALLNQPLGNAGAIKWSASLLTETFVVMPTDAIIQFDLNAALEFHRAEKKWLTQIVYAGKSTGAYIIEPRALECIPPRTNFDIESQLIAALPPNTARDFATSGYVNLLAAFNDYHQAQVDFLKSIDGASPIVQDVSVPGRRVAPGIWVGRNNAIHPRAQLAPPVCIGDDCLIGDQVELGPNAIIGNNVIIDERATIQTSTVLDNTYVGRLVNLQDRIADQARLIDATTGQAIRVADNFLLAENSPAFIGNALTRLSDGLIALGFLIVTLPISIMIGILSLLASGKLIARLSRVGKRPGQTFDLVRFETRRANRSMNALGRALNRWELDRWLEWWNVLRGDLGIVGVKPLALQDAATLIEDWQRKRFECAPGLTGMWYTQLPRASTLEEISITEAYYAATRTTRQDWRIVFETPRAWWRRATRGG